MNILTKTQARIDLETESGRYLLACCRIRHISLTNLINRLIKKIAEDQLVLAVLDDDSRPVHDRYFYRRNAISHLYDPNLQQQELIDEL